MPFGQILPDRILPARPNTIAQDIPKSPLRTIVIPGGFDHQSWQNGNTCTTNPEQTLTQLPLDIIPGHNPLFVHYISI